MFFNVKALSLFGALVAGGLVAFGSPGTASAQFGPGFGYGPGYGIGPGGSFGGISVNVGIGRTGGIGSGCHHGCKSACRHIPVPPVCPPVPAYGRFPGHGYGGTVYREFRTGYGFPGPVGFPGRGGHHGHGRFPGHGRPCW